MTAEEVTQKKRKRKKLIIKIIIGTLILVIVIVGPLRCAISFFVFGTLAFIPCFSNQEGIAGIICNGLSWILNCMCKGQF